MVAEPRAVEYITPTSWGGWAKESRRSALKTVGVRPGSQVGPQLLLCNPSHIPIGDRAD